MESQEHSFLLRFRVRAEIPEALLKDDFDDTVWRSEWEQKAEPAILRAVFQALRAAPQWSAHVRSRGAASEDEVEVVVERVSTAA